MVDEREFAERDVASGAGRSREGDRLHRPFGEPLAAEEILPSHRAGGGGFQWDDLFGAPPEGGICLPGHDRPSDA